MLISALTVDFNFFNPQTILSESKKITFSGMNEDIYICKSYFLTHEITASEWQSPAFQVIFCCFCGLYPWDCWDVVLCAACAEEADSWYVQEYYLWLP